MRLRAAPVVAGVFGVLLWFSPVGGQQPPDFEGDEVIVPGRRTQSVVTTPAYVTVIPGSVLRQFGFLTLADALRFLAELYVRSAGYGPGGLQQLSIRGTSPQQVLIMIDGVPVSATSQFGVNLSTIALADVERVEILRGPYSAIYGSGALGGVVNVVTSPDPRSDVLAAGGITPAAQLAVRIGGRFPWGTAGAGAEQQWTQGDRPNADAQRLTATGRIFLRRAPRDPAGRDTDHVVLQANYTAGAGGAPGSVIFPSATDRVSDFRALASLTWTRRHDGGERHVRVWALTDGVTFQSPAFGFVAFNRGTAVGVNWQQVRTLRSGLLTWGLDAQQVWFSYRDASPFGGSAFTSSGLTVGAYVQYDVAVRERTLLGLGLRYDVDSNYGGQLNPRVGFVHFVSPRLRLRGGIGRTFRGPTFGELFFPGCSNPALKPETAWSADVGLEATVRPGLLLRLNTFATDARNLIIGGCAPRNVGAASITGASAELVGRVADRWALSANLTWTHGVDAATARALIRLPAWQGNLILRYSIDVNRSLALLANSVSGRPDLDTSTFPARTIVLPPYLTVAVRYEQRVDDWVIRVGIDNLFNTRYQPLYGYPAPGRTLYLQFGRSF